VNGLDFLLARPVADADLQAALAAVLDEPAVAVAGSLLETSADAPVAAETRPAAGDFRTQVAVYVKDGRAFGVDQVRALAAALATDALVPDDSANPYTMLRVRPDGTVEPVALDPVSLDEREEYRVRSA
jgi:hypothetical protein